MGIMSSASASQPTQNMPPPVPETFSLEHLDPASNTMVAGQAPQPPPRDYMQSADIVLPDGTTYHQKGIAEILAGSGNHTAENLSGQIDSSQVDAAIQHLMGPQYNFAIRPTPGNNVAANFAANGPEQLSSVTHPLVNNNHS